MLKKVCLGVLLTATLCGCEQSSHPAISSSPRQVPSSVPTTIPTGSPAAPSPLSPSPKTGMSPAVPSQGLLLWLKAESGVSGSTTVTGWTSQSEGKLQATAKDPAKAPQLVADGINGQPALRFDGKGAMLQVPLNIGPKAMPSLTVITVFRSSTAEASPLRKVYGHDDGGYDRAAGLDDRGGDKNFTLFTGDGVLGYFAMKADTPYILMDQYEPGVFSGWVNGALALDKVKTSHGEGLGNFYIGGSGTTYDQFWQGDIAEVLVYGRPLTDAERTAVVEGLGSRYKIPVASK